MKKCEKLKANYEFNRLYAKGKSFVSPTIVIYVRKTGGNRIRFGITASKKLGSAVVRNRAKRVITAAVRECLPGICSGCEMVIVARSRILTVKSTQVAMTLKKQLSAAGIWCEDESCKQGFN